ncbi:MAG: cupin domain-containing protein [Terrimicrobiaceae bacterium]|jgi:hypothetical protein
MDASQIISHYRLEPLPLEGGYFRRFYTHAGGRRIASAIYYLITREQFSAMHRLPSDELFHFYEGHAVEMLQLSPDGTGRLVRLGSDIGTGHERVGLVPGGNWQGMRLADGAPAGAFALFGVSVHPEFRYEEFELGDREVLGKRYPDWANEIQCLTR